MEPCMYIEVGSNYVFIIVNVLLKTVHVCVKPTYYMYG